MTFKQFTNYVKSDLYRYCGNISIFYFLRYYFFGRGFHYTFWMRFCSYLSKKPFFKIFFILARLNLYRLSTKYGIEISYKTKIGYGLYIGHFGCVVVNTDAVFGNSINLSQGVIGQSNKDGKILIPIIKDNVYIGPGAKIFGDIILGNNVAIGANSVVNKSVEDNSIVVGIPGKVISNNSSKDYIQNKWMMNEKN